MGDILYLCSSNGVDALHQLVDITLTTIVQIVLSYIQGKLLTIVTGNGYLSFQLALGCSQLAICQRMLHDLVQLTMYQSQATLYVVMVTTEID